MFALSAVTSTDSLVVVAMLNQIYYDNHVIVICVIVIYVSCVCNLPL